MAERRDVTYWVRRSVAGDTWFKLVDGQDHLLRDGTWEPFDTYKWGPSWWRLTGEADVDRVEADELPPHVPR